MSELIRKLKEKKYITKIKVKEDISDELISKEIPQVGSVKIVAAVKEEIGPVRPPYAVMRETNPELMDVCVAQKWAAKSDYMTYEEAAVITGDMIKPQIMGGGSNMWFEYRFKNVTHFEEFEYFIGVEEIGSSTFNNCSSLTSINIPNSITSIGEYAFSDCSSLESITIPDSVTSIGSGAFQNCSSLTSIIIPNSVTSIGYNAFFNCRGLTSITISSSVTSIGPVVFGSCGNLESIVVESGNTKYNSRDNCNAIIETDTNTLIRGCKNTIIPNSITSIGDSAFDNCKDLTSIEIPDSVTSIGSGAFQNCSSLTSIIIPNSVTSIGVGAFRYCGSLASITSLATTAPTVSTEIFGTYDSNYTGRNTYNQGTNKLKVPTGATGYDTGEWLDPLCNAEKCGFTIEYI